MRSVLGQREAGVMYHSMFVFVFVLVLDTCVCDNQEYSGTLRLVNVVFRHGKRTPVDTYPKDPYINYNFHPFGWGQLTNVGKQDQFHQGQYLRKRYDDFLGDIFTTDLLRIQSTDVDRAKMSALLVAAGLFPPKGYNRWNPDLDWQPVPLYFEPLDQDKMLLVRIPCPRYHEELDAVKVSPEVTQYTDSLKELYSFLSENSGMKIKNPDDVQDIYNTMLAETQNNLTLPEWTEPVFPDTMETVTAYSFVLNAYNDQLKKIKGGPLLKKILQDSLAKSGGKLSPSQRKMFMYAGHDSTVANLMRALNVWDQQVPVTNIMAVIELHQIDGVYGWKVFLRNATDHEAFPLRIPGCADFCPLGTVVQLTKNVLPDSLEEECKSKDPNYVPPAAAKP